jgi:hypothetical protein
MVERTRDRPAAPHTHRTGRSSGGGLGIRITRLPDIFHNFSPFARVYTEESGGLITARSMHTGAWKRMFRIHRYTCPGLPRWLSIWA